MLACVEAFAARADNPVLSILPASSTVETGRKYPEEMLNFGAGAWRAYYHCHPERLPKRVEHGHFHIFRACEDNRGQAAWTHVAGLSMDGYGQPRTWFTVNRWVSGGEWLDADKLSIMPAEIQTDADATPSGDWLAAMLAFYAPRLRELLRERDSLIDRLAEKHGGRPAIFDNREVYFLSDLDIQLDTDLAKALAIEPLEA